MKLRVRASRKPDGEETYIVEAKKWFLGNWDSVCYDSFNHEVEHGFGWRYTKLEHAQFEVDRIRTHVNKQKEIAREKAEFKKNTVHWIVEV
jgi:hypothetical protein